MAEHVSRAEPVPAARPALAEVEKKIKCARCGKPTTRDEGRRNPMTCDECDYQAYLDSHGG